MPDRVQVQEEDATTSTDDFFVSPMSPAHTQEEVEEEDPAEESPDFSDEHLNYCLKSDEFSSQESWRIQNESDDTDIVSSTSTLPIFSNLVPAALKSAGTLPLIDLTGDYPTAEEEAKFEEMLEEKGWVLRLQKGDGNCLFRAFSEHIYGDPENHPVVRKSCMDYMQKERDHFCNFITESFTAYVERKRMDGVFGNNVEIQALGELYNRPVEVYMFRNNTVDLVNIFHSNYETDNAPVRLSYHGGNHYNAVVDPSNPAVGVGLGIPGLSPAAAEKEIYDKALEESDRLAMEEETNRTLMEVSDLEATEKELENAILEASMQSFESSASTKKRPRADMYHHNTTDIGFWKSYVPQEQRGRADSFQGNQGRLSSSQPVVEGDYEYPESVQEMVMNGFPLESVLKAYEIGGDSVDLMLSLLMSGNL